MRMWSPVSGSDSSTSGDKLTPWERANLAGFSCQPLTVLNMASMSREVITITEQGERIELFSTKEQIQPTNVHQHTLIMVREWSSIHKVTPF